MLLRCEIRLAVGNGTADEDQAEIGGEAKFEDPEREELDTLKYSFLQIYTEYVFWRCFNRPRRPL